MTMMSVYPDFLSEYSCKCGKCRRTCCRNDWKIVMSEEEYRANTDASLGDELRGLARAHMKRNPSSKGAGDYACVEMHGDENCPYLDDEGLCEWMSRCGRHIGSTCTNFPRTCISYCGREYLMPSGGCEAVLEVLAERQGPIRMANSPSDMSKRNYFVVIDDDLVAQRPLLAYYPQLIEFGLAILQNRSRSLDERMAALLQALSGIDALENVGDIAALPALLERDPLQADREGGHGDPDATAWMAVFACGEIFSHFCRASAHAETALRIVEGLGVSMKEVRGADGKIRCMPSLRSPEVYPSKRKAFDGFFEDEEIFLEHVMASLYLKMLIPIREPGVWTHAVYFAAVYAAIKGGLIGLFSPNRPEKTQAIDALVEIIRMVAHSELIYPETIRRMKEARLDDLRAAQALVRS